MANLIFEYHDYKKYLRDAIESLPKRGRGARKQLAETMGCQNTFVSHVLSGTYHLSLEQAEKAARFFHLSGEETEYFLILVNFNRSGTKELASLFEKWLEERREKNLLLKNRLKIKSTFDLQDQAIYLSHWYYAAIHSALTIPKFQTPETISERLRLDLGTVRETLSFLENRGLARIEKERYKSTKKEIHFDKETPLLAQLHKNFRLLAVNALDQSNPGKNLHYSAVVSCSLSDIEKVRRKLTKALEECIDIIRKSSEEELAVINIDWFSV